jgi:hypothetical protein
MDRLRRHPIGVLVSVGLVAALWVVAATILTSPARGLGAGWSIVVAPPQTPQSAQKDVVLLGSSCANAWSCWAAG